MATNKTYVLYTDHKQHPSPITECFIATASRRLSSSVARYPPSTTTAVDSAYCPQCLRFFDAVASNNVYEFQCANCQKCPHCLNALSIQRQGEMFLYSCNMCDYTSADTVSSSVSAENLLDVLNTKRKKEQTDPFQAFHDQASQFWEERKLMQHAAVGGKATRSGEEWSLETLETRLERQKSKPTEMVKIPDIDSLRLVRTTIQEILESSTETEPPAHNEIQSFQLQPLANPSQALLPLPTPLYPRLSRRCRAELAEGRPGILLKPKLNVVEGDSSLATGHGQWHRKDSSAIAVVPRVRVLARHSTTNSAILFRVTNPTLGVVRLRFLGSSYAMQHDDVLVDSLTQQRLPTVATLASSVPATETVELQSAEDSILELGGASAQRPRVPAAVAQWNPTSDTTTVGLRLLAQQSAAAWFAWVLSPSDSSTNAVSLTMQIEVGNGSWESSLIRPQGENDVVDLDLIFAWEGDDGKNVD